MGRVNCYGVLGSVCSFWQFYQHFAWLSPYHLSLNHCASPGHAQPVFSVRPGFRHAKPVQRNNTALDGHRGRNCAPEKIFDVEGHGLSLANWVEPTSQTVLSAFYFWHGKCYKILSIGVCAHNGSLSGDFIGKGY